MALPERVLVSLTFRHLNEGLRCSYYDCPIALAILEHFPRATWIRVSSGWAKICVDGRFYLYSLPIEAGYFQFAYDLDRDVPLIEFEMTLL